MHAGEVGRSVLELVPAQAVLALCAPLQRLVLAAVRAGHVVAAGIGLQVGALDARKIFGGGRGHLEHLAPRKGAGALFGQRHRVALAVNIERVGVDFVQKQVAHWHRAQAGRAVAARHHQHAASKIFHQRGVGVVAAAVFAHFAAQYGRLLEHGRDALPTEALGHVGGGLHAHDRAGFIVDDVAQPVHSALALANLRGKHHHHLLHAAAGAQVVHDLAQVRGAVGAPGARLAGGFAGQHPVRIRPLADRDGSWGAQELLEQLGHQALGARRVGKGGRFADTHG